MGQASDVGGKVMLFVTGEDVQKITGICVEFHSVGRDGNQKKWRYAIPPASWIFRGAGWNAGTRTLCVGFELRNYISFGWNGWTFDEHEVFYKRTGWLKWLSGCLGGFLETLSAKILFAEQYSMVSSMSNKLPGQKSQHQTPYLDAIYQGQKGNSEVKTVQVFH